MKTRNGHSGNVWTFLFTLILSLCTFHSASAITLAKTPLFLTQGAEPLVMLNMSKDHQLYFKAYDDYSDLDGDNVAGSTYVKNIDY